MRHTNPCTHLVLALPLKLLQAVALHLLRGHVLHHLTLSCRLCLHSRAVQACGMRTTRLQVHTCYAPPWAPLRLQPLPRRLSPAALSPKPLVCTGMLPCRAQQQGPCTTGLHAWLKRQVSAVKTPTCSSASSPARSRADWAECNCSRLTRLLARATFSSAQCMSRRWSSSMARRSLTTCRNSRGPLIHNAARSWLSRLCPQPIVAREHQTARRYMARPDHLQEAALAVREGTASLCGYQARSLSSAPASGQARPRRRREGVRQRYEGMLQEQPLARQSSWLATCLPSASARLQLAEGSHLNGPCSARQLQPGPVCQQMET